MTPAVVVAAMATVAVGGRFVAAGWVIWTIEAILAVLLVFVLSFFRDPARVIRAEESVMLSPADGVVSDIEQIEQDEFIGGPALRIGIFLSIFNTHINRAPCRVKVEDIVYKKGRYMNAMNKMAGKVNESNALYMVRCGDPRDKIIVRQVSGAIARRIVCAAAVGQELAGGEQFGMIKFGSRTELIVSTRDDIECLVARGDKVKAGLTALLRYQ